MERDRNQCLGQAVLVGILDGIQDVSKVMANICAQNLNFLDPGTSPGKRKVT